MANNNNTKNEKKGKMAGRPAGAKSKINLPIRNIDIAIEWTKKAYENAKDAEMSPNDVAKFIDVSRGFGSPAIAVLDKFGLIEKASFGWKISDLGKRAIQGDREAVREALERVDMFRSLLRTFGDKNVTEGVILDYLKKNFKKGDNTKVISDKYLEAINYLNSLGEQKTISKSQTSFQQQTSNLDMDNQLITLLKIRYLFYPEKEDKKDLINELYQEFKEYGDTTIQSIVSQIKQNQDNEQVLKVLINTLLNSFEQKYPALKIQKKVKEKQENKQNHIQSD